MIQSAETVSLAPPPSGLRPISPGIAGIRIAVLAALFTAAALYQASHLTALTDPDSWIHLRTGTWILEHHTIPKDGLFSQYPSLPWVDSCWGFDLLLATACKLCGLRGLPVLLMVLQAAIAVALFLLAGGARKNFWPAAIVAAIAQCCLLNLQPRPSLISIVFFALELSLLLHARRSGQIRALLWLPPLFIFWVNLDHQFGYGLMALALFFLATAVEYFAPPSASPWFENRPAPAAFRFSTAVFGACLLATLFSPYTYRLPELIWQSATSTAVDRYLPEFHSMRFRQPQDYLLLLLLLSAFLALGRRRSRDLFQISLLAVAAVISFRFQRDTWLVTLAAVGVFGDRFSASQQEENSAPARPAAPWETPLAATLVLTLLAASAIRLPDRNDLLMAKVAETFPVRAADYIRQNRVPQPLFNTYPWGSFLTWYLPEYPVVIDNRLDLYRDSISVPYFQLTLAEIPLESHPGFARAQTFLFDAKSPIAEALATLPGFRVAYRDDLACVLMRRN